MTNILMVCLLIAGLSLFVYLLNNKIIQLFKDNQTKNALIMLYATMLCAIVIVMFIALSLRAMMIEIADIFYRT
ncbi:hypothetical protein [Macrococcoides caseolyticum]|uniref:hypothetical protein n=1 Tax=Macrococcoides caseolyticum TaxID=69966 RepID=UPI001F465292|nr:hypothetical protein [Macrococcus caseolyticus]MCE4955883.1 hypothetical protein [Macrococcus caseolyticus]